MLFPQTPPLKQAAIWRFSERATIAAKLSVEIVAQDKVRGASQYARCVRIFFFAMCTARCSRFTLT